MMTTIDRIVFKAVDARPRDGPASDHASSACVPRAGARRRTTTSSVTQFPLERCVAAVRRVVGALTRASSGRTTPTIRTPTTRTPGTTDTDTEAEAEIVTVIVIATVTTSTTESSDSNNMTSSV